MLYAEGEKSPKMMSVGGTHVRISSKPGRVVALRKFFQNAKSHEEAWFAKRDEIAGWWLENYPSIRANEEI